jgi:hypothetical protein
MRLRAARYALSRYIRSFANPAASFGRQSLQGKLSPQRHFGLGALQSSIAWTLPHAPQSNSWSGEQYGLGLRTVALYRFMLSRFLLRRSSLAIQYHTVACVTPKWSPMACNVMPEARMRIAFAVRSRLTRLAICAYLDL